MTADELLSTDCEDSLAIGEDKIEINDEIGFNDEDYILSIEMMKLRILWEISEFQLVKMNIIMQYNNRIRQYASIFLYCENLLKFFNR